MDLCRDATRDAFFIEHQLGIPQSQIQQVLDAFPELFTLTKVNLGNTPATERLLIQRAAPTTLSPLLDVQNSPTETPQAKPAPPPALPSEMFSSDQLAQLNFKPASRHNPSAKKGRDRERKPLVAL